MYIYTYINSFALISYLEKDHSMIETRCLILSIALSRKIIKIYNDIARKYGNVTVKDFRKYEKLE